MFNSAERMLKVKEPCHRTLKLSFYGLATVLFCTAFLKKIWKYVETVESVGMVVYIEAMSFFTAAASLFCARLAIIKCSPSRETFGFSQIDHYVSSCPFCCFYLRRQSIVGGKCTGVNRSSCARPFLVSPHFLLCSSLFPLRYTIWTPFSEIASNYSASNPIIHYSPTPL